MTLSALATLALLLIGALFCLLGAIGVLRMPDLLTRIQAATKTSTLGVSCILLAAALHFGEFRAFLSAGLAITFLFLTAPVAAHVIARAAHATRVPMWDRAGTDALRERERERRG